MRRSHLVSLSQFGEKIRLKKVLSLLVASPLLVLNMACEQMDEAQVKPGTETTTSSARTASGMIGVNVLLNQPLSDKILAELGTYGNVREVITEIKALTLQTTREKLAAIQKLPYVSVASQDAERQGGPVDAVSVEDFEGGANTWNLDAVNVTDYNKGRTISQDATGVYVGVLDTGLLDSWRQYFPEQRIATQYAKSFSGGGGEIGNVSEQPNKWEHDQNSHGTHVTSTIIGFNLGGTSYNGVAPQATIIPVKVLNQNGSGWSSVIARGIVYMAELKKNQLKDSPVVVNMSLGGSVLDAIEKAALDYAIEAGVIIVASAGNSGTAGMGYPGAYAPVISVASAGLDKKFTTTPSWWRTVDVPDPTNPADFYIADYSSRQKEGQELDVTAPGSNVVGPYQNSSGQLDYYYLSGTSMASPHVAGIVALMAQKNPGLTQTAAEATLKGAAIRMATVQEAGAGFITADAALNGGAPSKRTAMK
jgi:subtilisin family serine protease